ncbi:MAG: SpoIVB peptidase S55 domain-containing protein [Armatimonadota bacterium]
MLALMLAASSAWGSVLFRPDTMMRTSELQPGMKGTAKSVFQGTDIVTFNIEVLGVLENSNLGGDMILIEALDGPAVDEEIGIARGMSGSPVYIGDKLIGAIAFVWSFSRVPIGGVTAIEDMLEAMEPGPAKRTERRAATIPVQLGHRTITRAVTVGFGRRAEEVFEGADTIVMQPVPTPLYCSGFGRRSLELMREAFAEYGIEPMAGPGPVSPSKIVPVELEPGAAVGLELISGDFNSAAFGTVTYRDGDSILAFGHPFMQSGALDIPMATAWVHHVIASSNVSNKMMSSMQSVGRFQQDRPWSVAGAVGSLPALVPVTVRIHDSTRDLTKEFTVKVAQHKRMTPTFVLTTVLNAADATYTMMGKGTAEVQFRARTTDGAVVSHSNVFFNTLAPAYSSANEVSEAMSFLTDNPFKEHKLKDVEVNATITDEDRSATIESAYTEQTVAKAGDDLTIHVRLRRPEDEKIEKVVKLHIPEDVPPGALRVAIMGGGSARSMKARLGILPPSIDSLADTIREFERTEPNTRLLATAGLPQPTYQLGRRAFERFPSSLAGVLGQSRATQMLKGRAMELTTHLDTDLVVRGSLLIALPTADKEGKVGRVRPTRPPGAPPSSSGLPRPAGVWQYDLFPVLEGPKWAPWYCRPDFTAVAWPLAAAPPLRPPGPPRSMPRPRPGSGSDDGPGKDDEEDETPKAVTRQLSDWKQTSAKDFGEGKPKGTAVVSTGEVILAPALKTLHKTDQFYLWSVAVDENGAAFLGSGNEGIVYRMTPDGKVAQLCDLDAVAVHCLAIDAKGRLVAGTAPDGKLLRIDEKGKASLLCDVEQPYIWALVRRGPDLYAGTGPGGKILKIDADGEASVFADLPADHVLSLAFAGDTLYAGTGESGVVFKVTPDGEPESVYGESEKAISALAVGPKGYVYAGTAPGGKIIRIGPAGMAEEIYDSDERAVLSMWADGKAVYAGTGDEGHVLRIVDQAPGKQDPAVATLAKTERRSVTALAGLPGGALIAGTANMGHVLQLSWADEAEGEFTSEVFDADRQATWGTIAWEAAAPRGTSMIVRTRSGNAPDPDASWSPWSVVWERDTGARVRSPGSRYLQYRAVLKRTKGTKGDGPVLKAVRTTFLPENQRPEVELTAPTDGAAVSKKAEMKWKAEDPDKDTLLHKVYTSTDGGESWKALDEELDEDEYEWDTEELDDGRYAVKVVVSDELSNPANPRSAEAIAVPVVVDNTPPRVVEREVGDVADDKTVTVSALALDYSSPVASIEYRIGDEGKYRGVAPEDGICDSLTERFSFTTTELEPGKREIQFRVGDAAGNWFEDTVKVTVPRKADKEEEKKTDEEAQGKPEPAEEDAAATKPTQAKKGKGKRRRAQTATPKGNSEGK